MEAKIIKAKPVVQPPDMVVLTMTREEARVLQQIASWNISVPQTVRTYISDFNVEVGTRVLHNVHSVLWKALETK